MRLTSILRCAGLAMGLSVVGSAFAQFSDDFESYADGSAIAGQGGWEEWSGSSGVSGHISTLFAHSGTKSLNIDGNGPDPLGDDTVHQFNVAGGKWVFKVWTYVPTDATGEAYIILLNRYPPDAFNWSLQVHLNADTGNVVIDRYNAQAITQPILVKGQWVEFRAEIDLDADTTDYYYNGTLMLDDWSWKNGVSNGGDPKIRALDLYAGEPTSGGTSGTYFDDVSLQPATTTEKICATSTVIQFGSLVSGTVADTCLSDDVRMVVRNGNVFIITQSPITVEFNGGVTTILNPTEVKMTCENRVSLGGLTVRIDMRNYTTNSWEQVDQRAGTVGTDTVVTVSKTSNAGDYVGAAGEVANRYRVRDDTPAFLASWTGQVDAIYSDVTG